MNIDSYICEAIFENVEKHKVFYELMWEQFKEDGFVITDEVGNEIEAVFKATALQNIVGEFVYRMYDEVNETDSEDIVEYLANLGIYEDEIIDFCNNCDEIDSYDDDIESTIKNALDYYTEIVADKMLEDFSADDIFDYIFTATYDFEQDFVFAFEDAEEFQAFADSNSERLESYKEEYQSVMNWIENGMVC